MPYRLSVFFLLACSCIALSQQNVQVSRPGGTPEEVTIAINPANPDNLIAGANLRYVYTSTDGGGTWLQAQLPVGTYGDPCVIFDAGGRAYYAHLTVGWDAITVRTSDDGGKTWPHAVKLPGPSSGRARPGSLDSSSLQDKEWLVADMTTGPYSGNIYASWTDFELYASARAEDSSVIVFARSTDRGETFEPGVRINDKAGDCIDSDNTVEGAVPAVGPGGEVYVAWAGPEGLLCDRSFDGGLTWGKDRFISDMPGGWDFPISGVYRCNGLPVTVADVSTSPYRGTVYVNWVDHRNGDPDVFIAKSTDRGDTWSAPLRVNDDPLRNGRDQFFTWAAVDASTGELLVVFYDRRAYAGDSTDVFLARSSDGGATFVNECISSAAFTPTPMVFMGDYICVAAANGRVRPIWTRLQGGALSIHTALIDRSTGAEHAAGPPDGYALECFPNPANGHSAAGTMARFSLPERGRVTVTIHDMIGRTVATVADGVYESGEHSLPLPLRALRSGSYYCRLIAECASSPCRRQMLTSMVLVLR